MRALLTITSAVAACGGGTSNAPGTVCGTGTMLAGDECVATATACGSGTHETNGECVPDAPSAEYAIRTSTQIVADDERWDVIVFGRAADGTPATDEIVLNTDRPNAGTFDPPTFTLDELHHRATFTPCLASTPGCLGPLELTVALASAPTAPIARFPVELVAEPAIGSVEHCLGGGNVLYLEGERFIYGGALTLVDAAFDPFGEPDRIEVTAVPSDPIQGTRWSVELDSEKLGLPLTPGVYREAYQVPPDGFPGIKILSSDPYAYCSSTYRGEFQIHEYVFTTSLQRLTASFRQWCGSDEIPELVVSGCVHIE